ncbi:MAG TPA: DUF4097 family beta strand repeat-containing protein [Gemmatimonadaceae bacterium]
MPELRPTPLAALLATAVLASPVRLAAQGSGPYRLAGTDVAVYDLAGTVHLEAGSGGDVVVSVDRIGADASKLRVEAGDVGGRSTLRVVFPASRITYPEMGSGSSTTVRVGKDGTFDDDDDGGERVTITGRSGGLEAGANLRVAIPPGKRVTLHLAVGSASVANVDGDITVSASSANVTANGARGRLRLDTGSGDVRVTATQAELDIDTGSGSVTVNGAKADRVRLDTGSGDVTAADIDARRLEVDVGSGSIAASKIHAPDVKLDGGSGDVEIALGGDVDDLVVDTGSGDVTIHLPDSLGARIAVETGNGRIRTELPIQATRLERDHLEGTIGDGRGRIRIETGSGEVRLLKS